MPRSCDVLGCPNGSRRLAKGSSAANSNVIYHWVPEKEPRHSEWLSAVPIRHCGPNESSRRLVVCSLHFRPVDYEVNASLSKSLGLVRRVLSRSAVPSILPDCFDKQKVKPKDPSGTATLPGARDVENQSKFPESLSMKIGCCARRAKQVQCCLLTTSASIGVQVNRTVKESREKGTQVDFSLYQKKTVCKYH